MLLSGSKLKTHLQFFVKYADLQFFKYEDLQIWNSEIWKNFIFTKYYRPLLRNFPSWRFAWKRRNDRYDDRKSSSITSYEIKWLMYCCMSLFSGAAIRMFRTSQRPQLLLASWGKEEMRLFGYTTTDCRPRVDSLRGSIVNSVKQTKVKQISERN